MPGKRKLPVRLSGLGPVRAGRGGGSDPWRILAWFDHAQGPAGLEGREAVVHLGLGDLAVVLGAIPASAVEDPEDFRHLCRTMDLLRRGGKARPA